MSLRNKKQKQKQGNMNTEMNIPQRGNRALFMCFFKET